MPLERLKEESRVTRGARLRVERRDLLVKLPGWYLAGESGVLWWEF